MSNTDTITAVVTISEAETPWSYSSAPGDIEGPWASEEDCLAELREQGMTIHDTWNRDGVLWVAAS
jgi:hypothetical protein